MTLTIPTGIGLRVEGVEASMEMVGISVKESRYYGLIASSGASVKATQCEFSDNGLDGVAVVEGSKGIFTDCSIHHNRGEGVWADEEGSLVELRGEQTEIQHNKRNGLFAGSHATISIYIPSRSITALVHDNDDHDLFTYGAGKIQSQLSSSSLELTVIHPVSPQ